MNQINWVLNCHFINDIKGCQGDYLRCRMLQSRYLKLGEMNLITSENESYKKWLFKSQSLEEVVTPNILLSDLIC